MSTPAGLQAAHAALLRSVAEGAVPAAVAKDVSAILEAQRRIVETVTLEQRIAALGWVQEVGNDDSDGKPAQAA